MKRLNAKTQQPFKYGDIREDGYVFIAYRKSIAKKTGLFNEHWLNSESFKNQKQKSLAWQKANPDKTKIRSKKQKLTVNGRANVLINSAKARSKLKNVEFNLNKETIKNILNLGVCQLTGLPFDLNESTTSKNPYSPSLDRIDPKKGYVDCNVRIVLTAVNESLNEYGETVMLPILEKMVEKIKNK